MALDKSKMLDEICHLYGIRKDTELAERLGVNKQTVYRWRQGAKLDMFKISAAFPDLVIDYQVNEDGNVWQVSRKECTTEADSAINITVTEGDEKTKLLEIQISTLQDLIAAQKKVISFLEDENKRLRASL